MLCYAMLCYLAASSMNNINRKILRHYRVCLKAVNYWVLGPANRTYRLSCLSLKSASLFYLLINNSDNFPTNCFYRIIADTQTSVSHPLVWFLFDWILILLCYTIVWVLEAAHTSSHALHNLSWSVIYWNFSVGSCDFVSWVERLCQDALHFLIPAFCVKYVHESNKVFDTLFDNYSDSSLFGGLIQDVKTMEIP